MDSISMRVIFKLVLFLNLIPSYTLKAQLQSKHKVSTLSVQKLSERDSVMFAGNYAEAVKLGTQLQANTVGKYRELIKLTQGREDSFSKKIRFDALNNIASYYWKTGKFNTSGLTRNQVAARSRVTTAGGLIVDRTTSSQLGKVAQSVVTGAGGQKRR